MMDMLFVIVRKPEFTDTDDCDDVVATSGVACVVSSLTTKSKFCVVPGVCSIVVKEVEVMVTADSSDVVATSDVDCVSLWVVRISDVCDGMVVLFMFEKEAVFNDIVDSENGVATSEVDWDDPSKLTLSIVVVGIYDVTSVSGVLSAVIENSGLNDDDGAVATFEVGIPVMAPAVTIIENPVFVTIWSVVK